MVVKLIIQRKLDRDNRLRNFWKFSRGDYIGGGVFIAALQIGNSI